MNIRGVLLGLCAAALFGMSAPFAKLLLSATGPLLLAGLLYLGGGVGLVAFGLVRRAVGARTREAPLRWADAPAMALIVLLGGAVAPWLMLVGLSRLTAVTGSLLLNLEGPTTVLVAAALFREHLGGRVLIAAALIFGGAGMLGFSPEPRASADDSAIGALCIAAACVAWALDNNLTQRLALKDPLALSRWKTLGAGSGLVLLALATGAKLPEGRDLVFALALGAGAYGASITLDAYALRLLGAAREAALFATAPFVGVLLSVLALGEPLSWLQGTAGALMAVGVVLLLRERHGHLHTHEPLLHEHLHVHDEHHAHDHEHDEPVDEPHSHPHQHEPLTHDHPHTPDAHHRHRHH